MLPQIAQLTQIESRACITAAQKAGVKTEEIRQMAIYRRNAIRDSSMPSAEIIKELNTVSGAFGAREKLTPETIAAAVELITSHFAHLAAAEITKAYQLNAAGLLEERAETWGGKFSVDQLGKVLKNYDNYRRGLMAALIRELEAIREAERQQEREDRMKAEFEDVFFAKVQFVKDHGTSWEDVPEFWFNVFKQRGAIRLTKQQGEDYFERAKKIADIAARDQQQLALLTPIEQRYREAFKIEPDNYAKTVARKMVVYDFLKGIL